MLGTLFHLTDDDKQLHHRVLELFKKHLGGEIIPSNLSRLNDTDGPGKKVEAVITHLSAKLNQFIDIPHEKTQHAITLFQNQFFMIPFQPQSKVVLSKQTFKDNYAGLNIQSATLCSYLLETLRLHGANEDYPLMYGYFALLSSFLYFNAAVISYDPILVAGFLEAHENWIRILELNYYTKIQDKQFHALYTLYHNRYYEFLYNRIKDSQYSAIFTQELAFHIERQNKRSTQYEGKYKGEIIRSTNSSLFYIPDPKTVELFIERLKTMRQKKESRIQFLYYYNAEFGHVETFDVHYIEQQDRFEIVNVNSAKQQQLSLLALMTRSFDVTGFSYQILTCDADLQEDHNSCSLYAFLFSRLLAKTSFIELFPKNTGNYYNLEKVQVFPITALGINAVKMAQSFTKMKSRLELILGTHAKAEQTKKDIIDLYSLKESQNVDEKICYVDVKRQRLSNRYTHTKPNCSAIKQKFNTTDDGIALRRASAGYCAMDEFEALIEEFKKFELNEKHPFNTKGTKQPFTALQQTFRNNHPKRAAILLQAGADPLSAKEMYESCSEEGAIKKSPIIKSFFK